MAFVPTAHCCKVEVFITGDGQQMENVFHVTSAADFTSSTLEDVVNVFRDWVTDHWTLDASHEGSVVGFRATALHSDTAPVYEPTLAEPLVGQVVQDMLPLNVAVVVSWKTALRGRSYRGRTYHTCIPVTYVDGSLLKTGAQGGLVSTWTALLGGLASASLSLAVLSLVHDKAPRVAGVATPITSLSIDLPLDSQRRRLPGRGS